ncbi:hypothetical protein HPB48_018568 [Haemaphysalis longicornis]|uniref:Uncharacterized protein n=1 Tax=Haemaphysalis longicornis TaxID=44386 RepID=A0A9J6GKQ2_HAELO|nr:hypothetical protein HPB48_018568 [Haemaphysalis longicornis]
MEDPSARARASGPAFYASKLESPASTAISKRKVRHPFTFCAGLRTLLARLDRRFDRRSGTQNSGVHSPPLQVPGIEVYEEFLTPDEESRLADGIDTREWQDFGPRVHFKKKRVRATSSSGSRRTSRALSRRCGVALRTSRRSNLANLDYSPKRGSCIDPHYDDWWLWGPRLVTFNLLSDTVLTLPSSTTVYERLQRAPAIGQVVHDRRACKSWSDEFKDSISVRTPPRLCVVQVALPRRSMLVLDSDARYKWHHSILRDDITSRRIAMTVRELSEEFLEGGASCDLGAQLLDIAKMRV